MTVFTRDPVRIAALDAENFARLKQSAVAELNDISGKIRSKYITISPGQDMIYLRKDTESALWLTSLEPDIADYPLIAAELGITGETPHQVAQVWAYMSNQWVNLAAAIEHLRLSGIEDINNAADFVSVYTATETFKAAAAQM